MRIELDIEKTEDGFDIYVSDENCGSGISVVGNTAEEVVENLTPYLHDYLYRMEHSEEYEEYEEYDEDEEYASED